MSSKWQDRVCILKKKRKKKYLSQIIWQKWYAFIVLVFYHSNMSSFTLFQTSLWWPSAIMMGGHIWGSVDSCMGTHQNFGCLILKKNAQQQWWRQQWQNVPEVSLRRGMFSGKWWKRQNFCEETSCIGDFLYFCMRCLALISLPMRRASVCGFLHEANVAVDFSFSSLSLCDIV